LRNEFERLSTTSTTIAEVVAETVLKAATAKVPRRRYAAGKKASQTSFLRRFVPEAVIDKSLRKQMGLPV
jgi:hypothetical protein